MLMMAGRWPTVFNSVQHARLTISRKQPTDTYLAAIADLRASQYPSATRRETSTCAREKVDRHWYPKSTPPTNNQIATCFNTQEVQDQTKNGLQDGPCTGFPILPMGKVTLVFGLPGTRARVAAAR